MMFHGEETNLMCQRFFQVYIGEEFAGFGLVAQVTFLAMIFTLQSCTTQFLKIKHATCALLLKWCFTMLGIVAKFRF